MNNGRQGSTNELSGSPIARKFAIAAFAAVAVFSMALMGCSSSGKNATTSNGSTTVLNVSDVSQSNGASSSGGNASNSSRSGTKHVIDFKAISQSPELPNGCEVTSLAAVLQYYGLKADKCDLSDNYLKKGEVGKTNFWKAFVGNPRESDAYGCYNTVIVETANKYLQKEQSSLAAKTLAGTALSDLLKYVDKDQPVIVWATQYNQKGHYSVTWHVDGEDLTWFTPEHCVVLVGYDLVNGLVYVADPLEGKVVSYDYATFESNYDDLGEQAVLIS